MNEQEIAAGAVTVAAEVLKEIAAEVYTDAAKPATHEAGEALGTIVGLFNSVVLYPVKLANLHFKYKLEQFEIDLKKKLDGIPQKNIQLPSISIAGPALEALRYNIDTPELREMYLNLLASAMNADMSSDTHPSFVEIIKSLSSDDAEVFSEFAEFGRLPWIRAIVGHDKWRLYPTMTPQFYIPQLSGYRNPFIVSRSIQNLARFGILTISDNLLEPDFDYSELCNTPFMDECFEKCRQLFPDPSQAAVEHVEGKGLVLSNEFGEQFARCCLPRDRTVPPLEQIPAKTTLRGQSQITDIHFNVDGTSPG